MPTVPVYLDLDPKTYAGVKAGLYELCGLAKNVDNKRIVKHIPTLKDAAKEGASNAIDFIRNHKGSTIIISGVLIIGGAVAGTIGYAHQRKQRKLNMKFAETLQNYLDATHDGNLNIEILNELISVVEEIESQNSQNINLNISATQFSELIHSIYDYTKRLAQAYNIELQPINQPKRFKKKTADDLRYYLNIQKQILEQAA